MNSLRSYACKQFKCYFHTWGNGGPNWKREFARWQKEEAADWTLVSPNKRRTEAALRALKSPKPKYILHAKDKETKTRRKIYFASVVACDACAGYSAADSPMLQVQSQESTIQFGSLQPVTTSQSVPSFPDLAATTSSKPSYPSETQLDDGLDGLSRVVDDIAFRFWKCSRCLTLAHYTKDCKNKVRCKACFKLIA